MLLNLPKSSSPRRAKMRHQPDKFRPSKKPLFYCDEDFPQPSLAKFKNFKVKHAVLTLHYQGRDDKFHYRYSMLQKAILVTLDDDYLDNKKFKLNHTYGTIVLSVGQLPTWERVN